MEKTIEQLIPTFNNIYQKLSNGADFGWDVVVKQQVIKGYFNLFIGLFIFFIYVVICFLVVKSIKKYKNYEISFEEYGVFFVISFIVAYIIVIFFWNGIPKIINPEFYAINYFINLLK